MNTATTQSAPPKRAVPFSVSCALLFGGLLTQIFGWVFFGFGMLFVWVFGANADFSALHFLGETRQAQGVILRVEDTSASENERPIHAYRYRFYTPDDQTHEGMSYSTDSREQGAEVVIEYPAGRPERARIQGMRSAPFSPLVLFVTIFPLIGLGFIAQAMRRGLRARRLLQQGVLAWGRLVDKEPTGSYVEINKRRKPVYALSFAFTVGGREYRVTENTYEPEYLEDETQERLLYDPAHPKQAVMLDSLPGQPDFDADGNIRPASLGRTLKVLALPVLITLIHGLILFGILLSGD